MTEQARPILADRFEVGDRLGRGGMGDVFLGRDLQTGDQVAVKLLKPEIVEHDPDLVKRFDREGEMLRKLNHPNIVTILATLQEDGKHYIVMEYVGGGSLQDLLQQQPQLPVQRVLEIALDIADALTRAHRLNIIHRDIKPANVLIDEEGLPRLTDFGVAHMGDRTRLTETGSLIGTYAYLSPEACQGVDLDERADIWAFGVMLYEMLAGQRPFVSDKVGTLLVQIMNQPVPSLIEYRPDVPIELAELVHWMLEREREDRAPTVRVVGAQLEGLMRGIDTTPQTGRASVQKVDAEAKSRFATPTPSSGGPVAEGDTAITPPESIRVELPASSNVIGVGQSHWLKWVTVIIGILAVAAVVIAGMFYGGRRDDEGDTSRRSVDQIANYVGEAVPDDEFLILVAHLEPINTDEREVARFIIDDLSQYLEVSIPDSTMHVREYPDIVISSERASRAAAANKAAVIVWGSYTDTFIQLDVQIGSLHAFPYNDFPREDVERVTNLRVRMTDVFEESVTPVVLNALNTLYAANGDAFDVLRIGVIASHMNLVPAQPVGDSLAAYSYRASIAPYLFETQADSDVYAEEQLAAALTIEQHPLIYTQRSMWYVTQGRFDESREDAQTAILRGPDDWVIPMYVITTGSDFQETIDLFSTIVELRPEDWYAAYQLGALYYSVGVTELAIAYLDQAVALEAEASFPYLVRGIMALHDGQLALAAQLMQVVVDKFPDPSYSRRLMQASFGDQEGFYVWDAYLNAATSLALSQHNDVLAALENIVLEVPLSDFSLLQGLAYCNLGEYAAAEEAYSRALQLDPDFRMLYLFRAEVSTHQEDTDGAVADFALARQHGYGPEFDTVIAAYEAGNLTCENLFIYSSQAATID